MAGFFEELAGLGKVAALQELDPALGELLGLGLDGSRDGGLGRDGKFRGGAERGRPAGAGIRRRRRLRGRRGSTVGGRACALGRDRCCQDLSFPTPASRAQRSASI